MMFIIHHLIEVLFTVKRKKITVKEKYLLIINRRVMVCSVTRIVTPLLNTVSSKFTFKCFFIG